MARMKISDDLPPESAWPAISLQSAICNLQFHHPRFIVQLAFRKI